MCFSIWYVVSIGGSQSFCKSFIDDVERYSIEAYTVLSGYSDEILLNDKLISRPGIVIEDAGRGLWRLKSEDIIRKSVERRQI